MASVLDAERARLQADIQAALIAERGLRVNEATKARAGLDILEEVLRRDAVALLRRAQDHGTLALAIVCLEHAVESAAGASVELDRLVATAERVDNFSAKVLQAMPSDSKALFRQCGAIPTQSSLVQRFIAEVENLALASLVPPGGGLLAEMVGRIFWWCYVFDATATPSEQVGSTSEASTTRQNLEVLASAASHARGGHSDALSQALVNVEASLSDEVAVRSATGFKEIRNALLMRQALLALKSRAHCLSTSLPPLVES